MDARATRGGSSDDDSRCLLLALSHDELGVIVDGLADPLQPVVAVAFSSTCLGLRTPLQAALAVLKERHARAKVLSFRMAPMPARRDSSELLWGVAAVTADDMATLSMIMRTANGMPMLRKLELSHNRFGDAGVQVLCDSLSRCIAPSLSWLTLGANQLGLAGTEALAAALCRGAMPKLEVLDLNVNPLGDRGLAALIAPLRKLPMLKVLELTECEIGDEGVASLVDNLGKDDFKALERLYLGGNKITDAGMAKIVAAIDTGGLPKLVGHGYFLSNPRNPASQSAIQAVVAALRKRTERTLEEAATRWLKSRRHPAGCAECMAPLGEGDAHAMPGCGHLVLCRACSNLLSQFGAGPSTHQRCKFCTPLSG